MSEASLHPHRGLPEGLQETQTFWQKLEAKPYSGGLFRSEKIRQVYIIVNIRISRINMKKVVSAVGVELHSSVGPGKGVFT
jgi:hypothetical protein